jgi:hypothetical protein
LSHENKNQFGISNAMTMHRKRASDAIVFEGPTNGISRTDGVIHFPSDDNEKDKKREGDGIDLNTPSKTQILTAMMLGTYANCGVKTATLQQSGSSTSGTANSGTYTFPNGTQISFANCHIIQILSNGG